ncbi:MAG: hypothetical protein Q9185_006882, partial [Variospora sp. 1 TL-2023]
MDYSDTQNDSGIGEEYSASLLHPDKYDHEHISKLQVFTSDLREAIYTSFPRLTTPYTSVHVLLLRWAEDDLNVLEELTILKGVFETQFRFATEQWDIPSQNSTRALQSKLYDFQDAHQDENELLIVYYGGHGDADRRRGRSIWAAYNRPNSPTITWSSLQHLLENALPHVVIILDCCYAANAARDTAVGTTKELLAACGRENPTTGVGVRSFTSALIEELQAFGTAPFTIAMLHGRLVTMRWRLAFTPIYALLSEHGGHSVQLSPLPLPPPLSLFTESLQVQPVPGSFDPSPDLANLPPTLGSPYSTSSQQSSSGTAVDTRVLLAVSIAGDATLEVSQWKQWLVSQAPLEITSVDVMVEGVFQSHSTMLVTSISIHAWDGLPERAAYRFIGFVKSENRIGIGASSIPQKRSIHETDLSVAKPGPPSQAQTIRAFGLLYNTLRGLLNPSPVSSPLEPDWSSSNSAQQEAYSASMPSAKSPVSDPVYPFIPLSASTLSSGSSAATSARTFPNAPWTKEDDAKLEKARAREVVRQSTSKTVISMKASRGSRRRHEIQLLKEDLGRRRHESQLLEEDLCRSRHETQLLKEYMGALKVGDLARKYLIVRKQMWRLLADELGESLELVEAM